MTTMDALFWDDVSIDSLPSVPEGIEKVRETLFTALSARGNTTFIEARTGWSWLDGQGPIFRIVRRNPQLCT
jgi:hypothetical protein